MRSFWVYWPCWKWTVTVCAVKDIGRSVHQRTVAVCAVKDTGRSVHQWTVTVCAVKDTGRGLYINELSLSVQSKTLRGVCSPMNCRYLCNQRHWQGPVHQWTVAICAVKDTERGLFTNELSLSVQSKTLAGLYTREWAFLILSFINITAAVSLTLVRMVQVLEDDPKSSDFTFTILLLINAGTVTMAIHKIYNNFYISPSSFCCWSVQVLLLWLSIEYIEYKIIYSSHLHLSAAAQCRYCYYNYP